MKRLLSKAEWIVVTNGLEYTVRRYDKQTGKLLMTKDLPQNRGTPLIDEYAKAKIALQNQLFELHPALPLQNSRHHRTKRQGIHYNKHRVE